MLYSNFKKVMGSCFVEYKQHIINVSNISELLWMQNIIRIIRMSIGTDITKICNAVEYDMLCPHYAVPG